MLAWDERNPADRFGKHVYTLEQYGLNEAQIRERFASYCDAFGV